MLEPHCDVAESVGDAARAEAAIVDGLADVGIDDELDVGVGRDPQFEVERRDVDRAGQLGSRAAARVGREIEFDLNAAGGDGVRAFGLVGTIG